VLKHHACNNIMNQAVDTYISRRKKQHRTTV